MSGNGTAVGAALAVGEGDCVIEGEAFWPSTGDAQHTSNKPTATDAAYGRNVIMLFRECLVTAVIGIVGSNRKPRSCSRPRGQNGTIRHPWRMSSAVVRSRLGLKFSRNVISHRSAVAVLYERTSDVA